MKLSDQLQNAYMMRDKEKIDELLAETETRTKQLQKNTRVTPAKVNTVLNEDEAPAIKIYDFLNKIFGEDWWEWEFETIERMLWIKYGTAFEDNNRDKVWSIKHLCESNRPFLDWFEFNQFAVASAGFIADFEILRSPSPGMIINAVNTMKYIRPEESFSREVKKYICILLIGEGIYIPPLSIYNTIHTEFAPLLREVNESDWKEIYKRYQDVLLKKQLELDETAEDIQIKRLISAEEAAVEYGS